MAVLTSDPPCRWSRMDSLAPVPLPDDIQRRLNVYKAAGAVLLIAVWGWFALVKNDQTPIFVYLNIAVHETGHVLFRPFGELIDADDGLGVRGAVPVRRGRLFLLRKRDLVATAVAWGWAASALASAATYIGDADDGRLALLGATGPDAAGDWERILGVEFFDKVYLADSIAGHGPDLRLRALDRGARSRRLGDRPQPALRRRRRTRPAGPRVTAEPRMPITAVDAEQMWR